MEGESAGNLHHTLLMLEVKRRIGEGHQIFIEMPVDALRVALLRLHVNGESVKNSQSYIELVPFKVQLRNQVAQLHA